MTKCHPIPASNKDSPSSPSASPNSPFCYKIIKHSRLQALHTIQLDYLPKQLHSQVLQGDCAIHLFLLLQKQHEETTLHVPQEVTGPVGIHTIVAYNCTLLCTEEGEITRTASLLEPSSFVSSSQQEPLFNMPEKNENTPKCI